ncbi:auxin-responsive protein SAUR36-like [Mercurialis annua]|uniref:auxin-responsive protein SAUR36-like n=1 Tax=Mercurialis annua TaxID=3986 RepID=UPI00215E9CA1|nr:auxin-responsive protein SAUR36-like [Mercurialis annua]
MTKIKGFRIGKRLIRISRWIFRRTRNIRSYDKLCTSGKSCSRLKPITKLINWGRRLTTGAKSLCYAKPKSGYIHIGEEPTDKKPATVPKGHMAVYVGQKDGDFHRVLVPVFYFNHPLFGELLREAEKEYGFHQPGGITIPCGYSEFERVQTRIAAGSGGRQLTWKRNHYYECDSGRLL